MEQREEKSLLTKRELEEIVTTYLESKSVSNAAFLMADIMNLPLLRDACGHTQRDGVLDIIINLLQKEFETETFVAKLEDGEFAVFIPQAPEMEEMQYQLRKLCQKSHRMFELEGVKTEVYCCVGIAFAPEDGEEFSILLNHADIALLHAKNSEGVPFVAYKKEIQPPQHIMESDMQWLLDEATDGIYISDVSTYELLYINAAAAKLSKKDGCVPKGIKCYEYLKGNTQPCSYCKVHQMNTKRYLEREFHSADDKNHYILKGKQIEWAGRKSHIEYIIDNTKQALLGKEMHNQLKKEELLVECMKYLSGINKIEDAIHAVVEALGVYYKAENCFVLQYEKPSLRLTKVYCWNDELLFSQYLGVTVDEQKLKTSEHSYRFHIDETTEGCISISQPTDNEQETELMRSICYFIKNELAKKLIEQKLRETSQQLMGTLNSLQSGVVKYANDEDWSLVEANQIFYHMIGYSKEEFEELYQNKLKKIIREDYWKKHQKIIKKPIQNGNALELESCIQTKDGKEIYVIDRRVLVKETDEKDYWYGTYIDITEQVKARTEIERRYKNEIAYRAGMEQTGVLAFLRVNLTQDHVEESSGNYEFAQILEKSTSYDAISTRLLERVASVFKLKQWQLDRTNLLATFANGETKVEMEYQRLLIDGKINWVKTIVKMAKEPNSNDIIAFIYTYNIHKEKITSDMITHAANKVYDLMACIDIRTKETISYVQGKSEPYVFSYGEGDVLKTIELFVPNLKIQEAEILKEVKEKMSLETIEEELKDKEDYTFVIQLLNEKEKVTYKKVHYSYLDRQHSTLMLVRTDVTDVYEQEREQKENLMHALQSAKQANQAKTKFLSSMSHDIRTPMNAIIGMAENAQMQIEDKGKVKESLAIIMSSSHHLLSLINDVLDMSKIESGSIVLVKESFSLEQVVEEIRNIINPEIEKKNQQFNIEFKNVKHMNLIGDSVRISRILINLLNNACKFTQDFGTITLRIREEKNSNPRLANLLFQVEDNGKGIKKESIANIFDPFFREGESAINHVEGSGLGLSIVKNIVEASGGTIKVNSQLGKGTKFIVTMQIKTDPSKHKNTEHLKTKNSDKKVNLTGMHILLVEDHPINIIVAKNLLGSVGATIEVAENGAIGVEKFTTSKEGLYTGIFMDIQMPVMNGYEATREIRRSNHPQAKTIPIIAMTANVFKEDVEKAKDAGMNAHTGKPISLTELEAAMIKTKMIKHRK